MNAIPLIELAIAADLGETFPALALTVIHRGAVVVDAAWGWLDPETAAHPATPASWFDLASLTKLFTATAFLALATEHRLALDTPLVEIVPEFGAGGPRPVDGGPAPPRPLALPADPAYAGQTVDPAAVTFRHLLTHTSGIAPWRAIYAAAGPAPAPPDAPEPIDRATRWARGLAAICAAPFVGTPGDAVRYSDLGLMLLGEATARLHGTPGALDVAIAARVLEPLGLTTPRFNPVAAGVARAQIAPTEIDAGWRGRRVWGEVHDENAAGLGGVAGHAGLFAAARDVAALGEAWRAGDPRLGIAPELRAAAVRQQARTGEARRGLGWALRAPDGPMTGPRFGPDSFGHSGFTGTTLWVDPARALVVACLTNAVYPGREKPGIYEFRQAIHTAVADALA